MSIVSRFQGPLPRGAARPRPSALECGCWLWLVLASPAWAAAPASVGLLQVHTEGTPAAAYPLLTHLNVRGTLAHAFQNALRRVEPAIGFVDYTDLGLQAWEPSEVRLQHGMEPSQLVMKPWQGLPPGWRRLGSRGCEW